MGTGDYLGIHLVRRTGDFCDDDEYHYGGIARILVHTYFSPFFSLFLIQPIEFCKVGFFLVIFGSRWNSHRLLAGNCVG